MQPEIKFRMPLQKVIFFVNDAIVKSNYKVKAFDVRVMLTSSYENHIIAENIPLLSMKMMLC
jgi:hypothetical protein